VRVLSWLFAAALLLAARPAAVYGQIAVDDLILSLEPADSAVILVIPFRNETDRPFEVVVELNDWSRDDAGGHLFHPLGTGPESCGTRVSVSGSPVHVEAGGDAGIRLSYAGQAGDRCRVMVWLRTTEPFTDDAQGSINLVIRTGVKVFIGGDSAGVTSGIAAGVTAGAAASSPHGGRVAIAGGARAP
jgi:hypothetical protein